jgi:6-phosphogluconolactonase
MSPNRLWSRREFVAAAGLAGLGTAAGARGGEPGNEPGPHRARPLLVFAGFELPGDAASERIVSYLVDGERWTPLRLEAKARRPRALALHPKLPILYAAHCNAEHRNLPRGSVSTFQIDAASGALSLLGREPLSLSATRPEHLAVAHDGSALLVSAGGGGAYNFFSLSQDGTVSPVPYALKQTGSGPRESQARSRPAAVLFHAGRVAAYGCDPGADRLSHFSLRDGEPALSGRVCFPPGSGPAHVAIHPSGKLFVVGSELRPALAVVPIDEGSGDVRSPVQTLEIDAEQAGALAFNGRGDRVYLAARGHRGESLVMVHGVSPATHRLRQMMVVRVPGLGQVERIAAAGSQLLLAGAGGIASLPIDRRSGLLGQPSLAVRRPGAVSLAVRGV